MGGRIRGAPRCPPSTCGSPAGGLTENHRSNVSDRRTATSSPPSSRARLLLSQACTGQNEHPRPPTLSLPSFSFQTFQPPTSSSLCKSDGDPNPPGTGTFPTTKSRVRAHAHFPGIAHVTGSAWPSVCSVFDEKALTWVKAGESDGAQVLPPALMGVVVLRVKRWEDANGDPRDPRDPRIRAHL